MQRDLDRLTATLHDVLVVGGGIHGAATARAAARAGLRVALVEAADFGSGASWNSLKTIHGGLRHLQRGDIGHLRESVREQRTLLRIAPQLVEPLAFVVPCETLARAAVLGVGMAAYGLLAADRNRGVAVERRLPAPRLLGRRAARVLAPGLSDVPLAAAAMWYDAQAVSTERLLLAFLHDAAESGAALANHVRVVEIEPGLVRAVDEPTGRDLTLRARLVIDVTGHGLGPVLRRAGVATAATGWLSAMNLVVRGRRDGPAVGLRSRGRYLFAVPWRDVTMLGTDYALPSDDPGAQARAFLDECRAVFPFLALAPERLVLVHHGLVPGGPGPDDLATRPRVVDHGPAGLPGVVSAYPVKYTTARATAAHLVRMASRRLEAPGRDGGDERPLAHAAPLEGSLPERVRQALRDEMALHLDDVVLRRLDLGTAGPPPRSEMSEVEAVMAAELGWDEPRRAAERRRVETAFALAEVVRAG